MVVLKIPVKSLATWQRLPQANQSAMVEEKSMKGATPQHREVPSFPREGSGFAHIKLELSALHWQQDSWFKSLSPCL